MARNEMTRIGRFVRVLEIPSADRSVRTKRWRIVGNGGDVLGVVKWLNPWRQYVARMDKGVTWNHGCLRDVAAFLDEQTRRQRELARARRRGE